MFKSAVISFAIAECVFFKSTQLWHHGYSQTSSCMKKVQSIFFNGVGSHEQGHITDASMFPLSGLYHTTLPVYHLELLPH